MTKAGSDAYPAFVIGPPASLSDFASDLAAVLEEIGAGLRAKNAAYGDSALNPVRVFSKAAPLEQINVRLDDKLSRLMRGEDAGEDTEADLLGYLILKRVAMRRLNP